MSVNAPSLPVDDLRERTVDLLDEGVSTASEAIAPLAERASNLNVDEELRSAAGRVSGEVEGLIDDLEHADAAERRALLALALLAVGVALALVIVARRRRSPTTDREDED
jgi:hypothetical protein